MEFWGVEVKSGEPRVVEPGDDTVVHLSQACLGEAKNKEKGSVYLYVNIGGQKLVIGTLSSDKFPQIPFDLVFEQKFELSHNWKNGSVYFSGYKAQQPGYESDEETQYSDSDEEALPVDMTKKTDGPDEKETPPTANANATKPKAAAAKPKVKIVEPNKDAKNTNVKEEDDEDDDSSSDDDEADDLDEEMIEGSDESGDEDDDDDDSDEGESSDDEEAKMAQPSKKRSADSAVKTPKSDKKAKLVTPQKTDGKKASEHVATPHPAKQAGKATAGKGQAKQLTVSSDEFSCKTCNRTFKSDQALQSHNKAKHG